MLEELNYRLEAILEQHRHREKLQGHYQKVKTDSKTEALKRDQLAKVLEEEASDVNRLEGMSLQALFYTILGNKEQQLEKEKQEYLAARLKHKESCKTVEELEQEEKLLSQQLEAFGDLDEEHKALLEAKEKALITENGPTALQLNNYSDKLNTLHLATREVEEATVVGRQVQEALSRVINALKSASNWGAWDMLGGGALVTAVKHSNIDDAKAAMHEVQHLLRRFNYELQDVQASGNLHLELTGFETFSDYFFDNLIFDWVVQSKIDTSLESARQLEYRLEQLQLNLGQKAAALKGKAQEVQDARAQLLLKAQD